MKYYTIQENTNITHYQKIDILNNYYNKNYTIANFVKNNNIYFNEYLDFMRTPFITFSNKFKNIIDHYCENIFWEPLLLVDCQNSYQELYWFIPQPICNDYFKINNNQILLSNEIPHLLKNAVLTHYNDIKNCKNNIQYRSIVNTHSIILREDIVEHFLDENIYGVIFKPVVK